jgi:hypothetical protein
VVAGFQGVDADGEVTTLGRGGSDTTAVALAAALGAEECEIFTDTDGVYTTDPHRVPSATKLERIDYDVMLELAALGARVLHPRSVWYARRYGVRIHVRSSFGFQPGTIVTRIPPEEARMDTDRPVTGVALDDDHARIDLLGVPDQPGVAARVFGALGAAGVSADMIIQGVRGAGDSRQQMAFTVPLDAADEALEAVAPVMRALGGGDARPRRRQALDRRGGDRLDAGHRRPLLRSGRAPGANIEMIATSEVRISVAIPANLAQEALGRCTPPSSSTAPPARAPSRRTREGRTPGAGVRRPPRRAASSCGWCSRPPPARAPGRRSSRREPADEAVRWAGRALAREGEVRDVARVRLRVERGGALVDDAGLARALAGPAAFDGRAARGRRAGEPRRQARDPRLRARRRPDADDPPQRARTTRTSASGTASGASSSRASRPRRACAARCARSRASRSCGGPQGLPHLARLRRHARLVRLLLRGHRDASGELAPTRPREPALGADRRRPVALPLWEGDRVFLPWLDRPGLQRTFRYQGAPGRPRGLLPTEG